MIPPLPLVKTVKLSIHRSLHFPRKNNNLKTNQEAYQINIDYSQRLAIVEMSSRFDTVLISVPQPLLVSGTLTKLYWYLAALLNEEIDLLFYKVWKLAAPLTALHSTFVCPGTPVGNHWSRYLQMDSIVNQFWAEQDKSSSLTFEWNWGGNEMKKSWTDNFFEMK